MFGFFNKQQVIQQSQKEILELWKKQDQQREESKQQIQNIELEMKIGKLVIMVSNEIDNVKVGIAKSIELISKAKQPYLVVEDIISGQEVIPLGTVFDYSEQKFNALNKLEPNERIAIIYNKLGYHHVDKSSSQTVIPEDSEIWGEKVRQAVEKWKEQNPVAWKEMNE